MDWQKAEVIVGIVAILAASPVAWLFNRLIRQRRRKRATETPSPEPHRPFAAEQRPPAPESLSQNQSIDFRPTINIQTQQAPPVPSSEHGIRLKHDSRQVLIFEFSAGSGTVQDVDTLTLGNAATLRRGFGYSLDAIEMLLLEHAPLSIAKPRGGERYNMGGNFSAEIGSFPGMEGGNARLLNTTGAQLFRFARSGPRREHVIAVRRRRFRVMLESVHDKSKEKHTHIEWVFLVNEE